MKKKLRPIRGSSWTSLSLPGSPVRSARCASGKWRSNDRGGGQGCPSVRRIPSVSLLEPAGYGSHHPQAAGTESVSVQRRGRNEGGKDCLSVGGRGRAHGARLANASQRNLCPCPAPQRNQPAHG